MPCSSINMMYVSVQCEIYTDAVYFNPDPQNYANNEMPYWLLRRPIAISVETTAYALLAQMELGKYRDAGRMAAWLSNQQNYDGGFVSTQVSRLHFNLEWQTWNQCP